MREEGDAPGRRVPRGRHGQDGVLSLGRGRPRREEEREGRPGREREEEGEEGVRPRGERGRLWARLGKGGLIFSFSF